MHSIWLHFWLWSKNLIYSFLAFLKKTSGLSQHNTDIACSSPWGSMGMCREFCVFQSSRRNWGTSEDSKHGLVSFMLFPDTFPGAHSKLPLKTETAALLGRKMAFMQFGQWEPGKEWTKRLHFKFHSLQCFTFWKRCLTNHIIHIYLAIRFSSSGMNFESYVIIEQGSKNHLLVS